MTTDEAIDLLIAADPKRNYWLGINCSYLFQARGQSRYSVTFRRDGHESTFWSPTTLGNAVQAALDAIEAEKASPNNRAA